MNPVNVKFLFEIICQILFLNLAAGQNGTPYTRGNEIYSVLTGQIKSPFNSDRGLQLTAKPDQISASKLPYQAFRTGSEPFLQTEKPKPQLLTTTQKYKPIPIRVSNFPNVQPAYGSTVPVSASPNDKDSKPVLPESYTQGYAHFIASPYRLKPPMTKKPKPNAPLWPVEELILPPEKPVLPQYPTELNKPAAPENPVSSGNPFEPEKPVLPSNPGDYTRTTQPSVTLGTRIRITPKPAYLLTKGGANIPAIRITNRRIITIGPTTNLPTMGAEARLITAAPFVDQAAIISTGIHPEILPSTCFVYNISTNFTLSAGNGYFSVQQEEPYGLVRMQSQFLYLTSPGRYELWVSFYDAGTADCDPLIPWGSDIYRLAVFEISSADLAEKKMANVIAVLHDHITLNARGYQYNMVNKTVLIYHGWLTAPAAKSFKSEEILRDSLPLGLSLVGCTRLEERKAIIKCP